MSQLPLVEWRATQVVRGGNQTSAVVYGRVLDMIPASGEVCALLGDMKGRVDRCWDLSGGDMVGGIGDVRLGVLLIGLLRRANRFDLRQWMLDVFHILILFARAWARGR